MDTSMPPWYESLRRALHVARHLVRQAHFGDDAAGFEPVDAYELLRQARQVGWDGSDYRFWIAAHQMAAFTGSMPQHPQRSFLDGEVKRWQQSVREHV